ncbi:MAG: peptidylprolyl isomerase [Dehalococcoidia bacterium]
MSKWFYSRFLALMMCFIFITGALLIGCSNSKDTSEPTITPTTNLEKQVEPYGQTPKPASTPTPKVETKEPIQYPSPPPMMIDQSRHYIAIIHTNKGDITAELFQKDAPVTVNNFVFLSREGFYDGVPFHRVVKGFMIQTGDPTGTGTGEPGYTFKDEPVIKNYEVGTLAMANRGLDTNGSQFFICDADLTGKLPKSYTIFGRVTQGIDVVHGIASAAVEPQHGELSKPTVDLHISNIEILEKG